MSIMKKSFIIYFAAGLLLTGALASCNKEIGSLNGSSVDDVSENPTRLELNNLVVGSESGMRTQIGLYLDAVGILGREVYRFSGAEPRYTSELLGKEELTLTNNVFYLTNPWNARYRVVKNCNIIIAGATRSTLITDKQKKGYTGFAKTIKAYQLLLNLNYTETNGIRVDVADPDKLGPFLSYEESLAEITKLLDEGKTEIAGGEALYVLSSGFDNKNVGLLKFNRAIAARVAAYRKDWSAVLTALSESFFDINGDFADGFYHVFSTGPNDQTNPSYFRANNTGEARLAHPSFITSLTAYSAADTRKNKIRLRTAAESSDGLTGTHDLALFASNTSPMPIIRQEELILLYAEAKANLDQVPDAITAINKIRTKHGGVVYAGDATKEALISENLLQRRFSLFYEGHRWIDLRRYGRLDELPMDRANDTVFERMPKPLTEGQ
jgi:hypothetical protein